MTSNAICRNLNEAEWEVNAVGQDPCAQYAVLMASCDTNFMVPPMTNTSRPYLPTIRISTCACNVVAYNLASACTWCQGPSRPAQWVTQDEWQSKCTSLEQLYWIGGLPPTSRPPSVSIPHWAFDPPTGGSWDPVVAATNATAPNITISSPRPTRTSSSTTSIPSTTPVPSTAPTDPNEQSPPWALGLISVVLVIGFLLGLIMAAKPVYVYFRNQKNKPEDLEASSKPAGTHESPSTSINSLVYHRTTSLETGHASLAFSPTTYYPVVFPTTMERDENTKESPNRDSGVSTRMACESPPAAIRYALIKLVTSYERPFGIIQLQPFQDLFLAYDPKASPIDPSMLMHDIETVFESAKGRIKHIIQEYQGQFHLSCAGSLDTSEYVSINAQWTYKGHLVDIILDFISLQKGDDESFSQKLISILKEYGVENRIDSIVCNHAMGNGTNTVQLAGSRGKDAKQRCVCQSVKLIVKAITSIIHPSTKPGLVGVPKLPEPERDGRSHVENPTGTQEETGNDLDESPVKKGEEDLLKDKDSLDQGIEEENKLVSEEKLLSLASVEPSPNTVCETLSTKLEKSSLSKESTYKAAILGSWIRSHGLISDNDIVEVLK